MVNKPKKKIGVLIVTYNAVKTLAPTIERISPELMEKIDEIFVFDDHSNDKTYEAALEYKKSKALDKLKIYHNKKNLRYGGNKKAGYRYAIDNGFDIVVLLHGDGQYAPEVMAELIAPVENDSADLVMGSRMMHGQHALKGGMPLYKFFGNKILTLLENIILGMKLTEFHSGYRVYSCSVLKDLPIDKCSDDWHFDTDIIIQFKEKGLKIMEKPIPTYYGDEICYVNGIAYAFHCIESVIKYRLHKAGLVNLDKFNVR